MQVVHIEAGKPQVGQAGVNLMAQIRRGHAVAVGHHVRRVEDAGHDEGLLHVGVAVARGRAVVWDETALRCDQHFVATAGSVLDQLGQRLADRPLAALAAVVDRAVNDVAPGLDGLLDRGAIERVRRGIVLAEIRAEPDCGQRQAAQPFAEVPGMGRARRDQAITVPPRAFWRRVASEFHKLNCCWHQRTICSTSSGL